MPHYRILNSPEIATRASVISPPPCHKEPFPSVSAAGPGFLSRAAAHPSRQGTSTLAASISASGFPPRNCRRAATPALLSTSALNRLQEGPLPSGIQILLLHPATALPSKRQTVPQFPCLYERVVTSPTHPCKDLLLFFFCYALRASPVSFGEFSASSEVLMALPRSPNIWATALLRSIFKHKSTHHPGCPYALSSGRGVWTPTTLLWPGLLQKHTKQLSSPSRERCSRYGSDQRSNCWFPRPGAKKSSR